MFIAEKYVSSLISLLKDDFADRLLYVGLQGSYLRGEATEDSDIDIMVVIENLSPRDLLVYRRAIESLEACEKSCGFICGADEIKNWNALESCHLLHTTKDYYGRLSELVPAYTLDDVRAYVKISLGNLYHEILHRFVHAPREKSVLKLPGTYKGVFFILQNLSYLKTGEFITSKQALLKALSGKDKAVLETSLMYGRGENVDFDHAFELLFTWCRDALIEVTRV